MYQLTTNFKSSVVARMPTSDEMRDYYVAAYKAGFRPNEIKFEVKDIRPVFSTMSLALSLEG